MSTKRQSDKESEQWSRLVVAKTPLDAEPRGFLPPEDQRRWLHAALTGIELGTWDHRIVEWMAHLDTSTVVTVVSLLLRARDARPITLEPSP